MSAVGPALGFPLGANTKVASDRVPRNRSRRSPRPATAEARLRALGFTPKLSYAVRSWVGRNTIEKDWTADQLVHQGLCSPSTFSRAKRALLEAGLILEISEAIFDAADARNNRAALYHFTEKAYRLVSPRGHRLAKRTSPGAFELPIIRSQPYVPPHHSDVDSVAVVIEKKNLLEGQGELAEALASTPGPGLNPGGAIVAAKALSYEEAAVLVEAGPAFLSYLIEELSTQATRTPQALLVARLRNARARRDLVAAGKAWIRRRDAAVVAGDVAGLGGDLTPELTISAWKATLRRLPPPSAAGYLAAYDLERSAWKTCLDVARRENPARAARIESQVADRIKAQGIQPGSLVWSRAFAHGVSRDLAEATPWLRATVSLPQGGPGSRRPTAGQGG